MRRFVRWIGLGGASIAVVVLLVSFLWRVFISPPVQPTVVSEDGKTIQLRVLNATRVPLLARQVQEYLRRRGFDVVEAENAPSTYPATVVLDHIGDSLTITRVQYALGIAPSAKQLALDSNLILDCSVIIGDDWKTLRPFR